MHVAVQHDKVEAVRMLIRNCGQVSTRNSVRAGVSRGRSRACSPLTMLALRKFGYSAPSPTATSCVEGNESVERPHCA